MRIRADGGWISVDQFGEGPDLVMLHSLLTDRHSFDRIASRFADRWRVNLVDLPGFGDSSPVGPEVDAFADAVAAMLENGQFDPAATAVVGNGLGGFVALGLAIRHGATFDGLVLLGCGPAFPDATKSVFRGMIELVQNQGMASVVEVALSRIFPDDFLAAHQDLAEERRAALMAMEPNAFTMACQALIDVDYRAQLGTIRNPVLIVVGSEDRATPPSLAHVLAGGIPRARQVELTGMGHAPHLQDPAVLIPVLDEFLDR